jgi:hypothetical protein
VCDALSASGVTDQFAMTHVAAGAMHLACSPRQLALNCDGTILAVICVRGRLYFHDTALMCEAGYDRIASTQDGRAQKSSAAARGRVGEPLSLPEEAMSMREAGHTTPASAQDGATAAREPLPLPKEAARQVRRSM